MTSQQTALGLRESLGHDVPLASWLGQLSYNHHRAWSSLSAPPSAPLAWRSIHHRLLPLTAQTISQSCLNPWPPLRAPCLLLRRPEPRGDCEAGVSLRSDSMNPLLFWVSGHSCVPILQMRTLIPGGRRLT